MSIQTVAITDLYTALGQAARYYPLPADPSRLCDRLQAFRVVPINPAGVPIKQLMAATVCDKDKPYFYSRLWEERGYNPNAIDWNFPLLYAYNVRISPVERRPGNITRMTHTVEVGVIDQLPEQKGCVGCNGRTPNEVYQDTTRLLMASLDYLAGVGYYPVDGETGLLHETRAGELYDAGTLYSAEPYDRLLKATGTKIDNLTFDYFEQYTERVYGTFTTLQFVATGCQGLTWNFDVPERTVLAAEKRVCQNC